jgi:A/G-specific adenine glycosylase
MAGLDTPSISSTFDAGKLRKKLAAWFVAESRDLPWRKTTDPYAIAVSELMLQQTTVAAVIPYFERWMARFPNVEALARAPLDEVLACWQGLGYYSRARNLHKAAQEICENFGGQFPSNLTSFRSLPGFGPYSAGAVAAFAFDQACVVIDANIARVLARLGDIRDPIDKASGRQSLEAFAETLLPKNAGGRIHTGALMELGALVCKPQNPDCKRCPVQSLCRAKDPESLPVKAPRKAIERVIEHRAFFARGQSVGLIRSEGPRWRGLWLLPPGSPDSAPVHTETYPITRYLVKMEVVEGGIAPTNLTFFPFDRLPAMPSPHARAVAAVRAKVYDDES